MVRAALVLLILSIAPAAAVAQDSTLADIRQELEVLKVDLQQLTRELSTTGAATGGTTAGSVLERVGLMEQELMRLTARTEEMQFRIESVVSDGTNRIGDLEFRICELEPACDLGSVGEAAPLGGGSAPPPPRPSPAPATEGGAEMAIGEQTDFDRAKEALDSGSFRSAADLFAAFAEAYPGGPLTAEASFYRGDALAALGETAPAARAYLTAFSSAPTGPVAAQALLKLGRSLEALGQRTEACVTLGEVPARFPGTGEAAEADSTRQALGCG